MHSKKLFIYDPFRGYLLRHIEGSTPRKSRLYIDIVHYGVQLWICNTRIRYTRMILVIFFFKFFSRKRHQAQRLLYALHEKLVNKRRQSRVVVVTARK